MTIANFQNHNDITMYVVLKIFSYNSEENALLVRRESL